MRSVSVIVAAYNEQETIVELLERVRQISIEGVQFEVIVINDGSTDNTARLLEQHPDIYDKVITLPKNGGKGAAVLAGLKQATGDYILFQDADLEYDPSEYPNLLEPIQRFEADIVMGSRLVASRMTRVSYFWHRFGNRLITLIFNLMNNTTFTDVYSCYLIYRRELVNPDDLRTRGWEQHAEILTLAVGGAKSIFEIPISYFGRTYAEGKKIRAMHALAVIWTIFYKRVTRRSRP